MSIIELVKNQFLNVNVKIHYESELGPSYYEGIVEEIYAEDGDFIFSLDGDFIYVSLLEDIEIC